MFHVASYITYLLMFLVAATVIYCFLICCNIQKGQSVLIHAGSGGVGQAAINIALSYGLKVYTTVGTREKREFIKATWPEIKGKIFNNFKVITGQ